MVGKGRGGAQVEVDDKSRVLTLSFIECFATSRVCGNEKAKCMFELMLEPS